MKRRVSERLLAHSYFRSTNIGRCSTLALALGLSGCSLGDYGGPGDYDTRTNEAEPGENEAEVRDEARDDDSTARLGTDSDDDDSDVPTFVADPDSVSGVSLDPEVQEQALEVLAVNCGGCHGDMGPARGNFSGVLDVPALLASGRVVPGDPDGSPLLQKIVNGTMPPASQALRPSAGDVELLRTWIEGVSATPDEPDPVLTPDESCDQDFQSLDATIDAMARDIFSVEQEDREFTRYVTVTNGYNAGECEDDLEVRVRAASKLMNSLSFEPRIANPEPVDARGTLFRIDIRDFGWDRVVRAGSGVDEEFFSDAWERIVEENPYAIEFEGDAANDLKFQTETDIPFISANSFVFFSSVPPLYYEVLDLPDSVQALEAQLGVDVEANLEQEEVARAGFRDSGVSLQDRVIERHDIPASNNQSYWKSFDFIGQANNDSIFEDPLGFESQGGEIIFSLPNGLQGYLLADGVGDRVDEAPTSIVADPGRRDFIVRSGVSCMSCHNEGIIYKDDEVRSFVLSNPLEFDAETFEQVLELYVEEDDFAELQGQDRANYAQALVALDTPMSVADPVSTLFVSFEADVNARVAAAELGVSLEFLQASLPRLDAELQALAGDGTLERIAFTGQFLDALCILHAVSENTPEGCR